MLFASAFSIFHLIPAVDHDTLFAPLGVHKSTFMVFMAWLTAFVVIGLAGIARLGLNRALAKPGLDKYVPDSTLTPRNFAEILGGGLLDLFSGILGPKDGKKFFPYLAALFSYLLAANLIGLIPGLASPTGDFSHNLGLAVASFLIFNAVGLGRAPIDYIKHLFGPVTSLSPSKDFAAFVITLPLAFLLFPIEVFGLSLRPLTLTVRLTANMYGDHAVFLAMSDLVPYGVPAFFIVYGAFVSLIQAFVFTLLTTIYISLAKPHEHAEHSDSHGH